MRARGEMMVVTGRDAKASLLVSVLAAALLSLAVGPAGAADGAQPGQSGQSVPAWVNQLAPPPPRSFDVPVSPGARLAPVAPAAPVSPGAPSAPPASVANQTPAAPVAPVAPVAPAASAAMAPAPKPATLRGTLGNEQVQAIIRPKSPAEDGIEGSYFIFGGKQNILLAGEIEGESLWMEESENGVDVSGQWEGTRRADVIEGTWQSVDGSVSKPFLLRIMPPAPVQP